MPFIAGCLYFRENVRRVLGFVDEQMARAGMDEADGVCFGADSEITGLKVELGEIREGMPEQGRFAALPGAGD